MAATAEPLLDMSMWMNRLQSDHAGIRDRVDALEEGSQETNRRLAIVEHKVDGLVRFTTEWRQEDEKRFDALDRKLADHEKRFDAIDRKLADHEKRFDAIDRKLANHDKRFDAIDRRFEAVDQRFDAMDEKIDQKFSELKDLLVDALKRKN